MKRMLLRAATSSALALALPGVALAAHHGKAHHRAKHANAGKRHAQGAKVLTFGSTAGSTGTSAKGGTTAAAPTTATTPTSPETVGTVTSFTGGVLTITLTGGSTVSGTVTEQTELRCQPATPPSSTPDTDDQAGGSQGAENGGSSTQGQPDANTPQDAQQAPGGEDGQDGQQSAADGQQRSCTAAAIVPGAVVREAELSLTGSGAVWDQLSLIQ